MKKYLVPLFSFVFSTPVFADLAANHCEIFIDKVAGHQTNYHSAFGSIIDAQVFLKIDGDKLSAHGGAERVGFFGEQFTMHSNGALKTSSGQKNIPLNLFYSSQYFVFSLGDLENHWWNEKTTVTYDSFKGSFYVQAHDGTRLWTTPNSPGSNFVFDQRTMKTLEDNHEIYASSIYGLARKDGIDKITKTAFYNTYWNPLRCQ